MIKALAKPQNLLILLALLYFSIFFLRKINLSTADLGRHIKNGEVVLQNREVIYKNFYSYTQSDFPTVNHHWLSGIVFFLAYKLGGFAATGLLQWALWVGVILVVYLHINKSLGKIPGLLILLLFMPILATRLEIRPEVFSYFFATIYLYLMTKYKEEGITLKKMLPLLIPMQIAWVNLHIFFIFGIMIWTSYYFERVLLEKKWKNEILILVAYLVIASCLNPFSINGLLEPINIFKEYGYMLIENQSVFFMQKRFPSLVYFHFEIAFVLTILSAVLQRRENMALAIITMIFGLGTFKIHRLMPFFAISCVILLGVTLKSYLNKSSLAKYMFNGLLFIIATGIVFPGSYFSPFNQLTGIGLTPEVQGSADFFKEQNLKGPIFNNYDIGGYLIFNLYPQIKVFVDNRPEAYSVDFFQEKYIKMQEDEQVWKDELAKNNFNTIYFYRHDATPWAQPFLINRLKDPDWVPVFVDDYTIIFVRNNDENKGIIDLNRLPKEMFVITGG